MPFGQTLYQVSTAIVVLVEFGLLVVFGACSLAALWSLAGRQFALARRWSVISLCLFALVVPGVFGYLVLSNFWAGCSPHGGCPTPTPPAFYVITAVALVYLSGALAWAILRAVAILRRWWERCSL